MFTYEHDCIFVAYIVSYLDWVWLYTTSIKGDWGQWLLLWPFSFVPIYLLCMCVGRVSAFCDWSIMRALTV